MEMIKTSSFLTLSAIAVLCSQTASAAVILSSDFTGVDKSDSSAPYTATSISWTTNGINSPTGELAFINPGTLDPDSYNDSDGVGIGSQEIGDNGDVGGFHDVTANEIDVNQNIGNGDFWQTSFALELDGSTSSIDLTQLTLDLRLTNASGADNSAGSKSGQMHFEVVGSSSGSLGVIDLGGDQAYPTVEYTRTLDLSSLASLTNSETYTGYLTATGSGHGHHKSLQSLSLEGDITAIPEPSSIALLALAGLGLFLCRRHVRR
jgi:hypothetical protein